MDPMDGIPIVYHGHCRVMLAKLLVGRMTDAYGVSWVVVFWLGVWELVGH